MKTKINISRLYAVALLLLATLSSRAADTPQEVITVSTAGFGRPLVEQWVKKYAEARPDVQIRLVDGIQETADLTFLPESAEPVVGDENQQIRTASVGRYALLPVTTTENPLYNQLSRRRFDSRKLKRLFFQEDGLQEVENGKKKDALREGVTIYSGANRASGANAFAAHFGCQPAQLRGRRIAGDDLFLLTAIGKDHTGVTFNNLSYLFDLQNRRLKPHLSLLVLDLKKEQEDALLSGNLDTALQLLETDTPDLIPIEEVTFTYKEEKPAVTDFLHWVISEGQQYNHDYGFLTLDRKQVRLLQKQLEPRLTAN